MKYKSCPTCGGGPMPTDPDPNIDCDDCLGTGEVRACCDAESGPCDLHNPYLGGA